MVASPEQIYAMQNGSSPPEAEYLESIQRGAGAARIGKTRAGDDAAAAAAAAKARKKEQQERDEREDALRKREEERSRAEVEALVAGHER